MVGSSIVKRAFVAARNRPGGVCLGLQRLSINIWWQGKGGMVWSELYKKIKALLKVNDSPHYLILHCGGNDIGNISLRILIQIFKRTLEKIQLLLPNTKIIWSQLLPRRNWRYSENIDAMNKTVKRLNSSIAAAVVQNGGGYIKYPDINSKDALLFESDGVHLSQTGNEIFLNTICAAIEQFKGAGILVYPKIY